MIDIYLFRVKNFDFFLDEIVFVSKRLTDILLIEYLILLIFYQIVKNKIHFYILFKKSISKKIMCRVL